MRNYGKPLKRISAAFFLSAALCALGAFAPPAFGWEYVSGPPEVESALWHSLEAAHNPRTHVLGLSISTGYCRGEPPPEFDHIKVIEQPKTTKHPMKSAVITAYVRFPAPTEVQGEVKPGEPQPACAGVGVAFFERIRLKRSVEGMLLYDGSFSPPRRVRR
jgi:hypothetical protein